MVKKNTTMKLKKCKYESTFNGLSNWHKHMFEHLGWMVLAKSKKGMKDKISTYKKSLQRLKEALECKIKNEVDIDNKNDLLILWNDVNVLIAHVKKDF